MKACDIDTSSWETAAHNRTTWRKITHDGMKKRDEKRQHKWQERETNHHLNLQQTLPSNVTTAAKSVDHGLDFTATGCAVLKNDSTKGRTIRYSGGARFFPPCANISFLLTSHGKQFFSKDTFNQTFFSAVILNQTFYFSSLFTCCSRKA